MVFVILVIVLIALVVVGLLVAKQRRSQQLQQGFGPEYDRTVEERGGDRREAEAELLERRQRREKFEIRDLDDDTRERYTERWRAAQRRFVDEPGPAVAEADALVIEVMRDRGYPVADEFEQRAADVSVDHPEVVEHYRAAHGISSRATEGDASTEDLRQSMVHFRALFAELLGYEGVEGGGERTDERRTDERTDGTPQDRNVREMS
jgi:FtsZ-interacting cell division protein ZipA